MSLNRMVIAAAAAAAMTAFLWGCKPKTTAVTVAAPVTGTVRVCYIPKNTGNPYFDAVNNGFTQASSALHFKYTEQAPATADATDQIPIIQQQVQDGVNVIAISPNSPEALDPAIRAAEQHGVRVITIDADLTGSEQLRSACVLPTDFNKLGASQIELIGSLMGYTGDFAILSATTDAPNQNAWIAGMKVALKLPKYAGMHLVEIAYGNDDPQKSLLEAQSLMTKYPHLKGILSPTTVGIAAAAQAVETGGAAGKVQVTGLGTPNQMRRFVQDGTVKKFALWDPAQMGYTAGYLAYGLARGTIHPAAGVSFTAGTEGIRVFGTNNVISNGPLMVFNKSNIGQYHF